MLDKIINNIGQKDFQRQGDKEDRELPYKLWLRKNKTSNGFFTDIDMFYLRKVDGLTRPAAITELTRIDSDSVPAQRYLDAITDRYFNRDTQGKTVQSIGNILQVPVYLVLYPINITWLYVFSFQKKRWKLFSPPEKWIEYLESIKI